MNPGRRLAALLLVVASDAAAEICSHECSEVVGCFGGCSVGASPPCSAICGGGACNYRCRLTGRPHGVYRKFGRGRNKLREAAMRGDIPGLVKSSW